MTPYSRKPKWKTPVVNLVMLCLGDIGPGESREERSENFMAATTLMAALDDSRGPAESNSRCTPFCKTPTASSNILPLDIYSTRDKRKNCLHSRFPLNSESVYIVASRLGASGCESHDSPSPVLSTGMFLYLSVRLNSHLDVEMELDSLNLSAGSLFCVTHQLLKAGARRTNWRAYENDTQIENRRNNVRRKNSILGQPALDLEDKSSAHFMRSPSNTLREVRDVFHVQEEE
ncbi:hypothetical protein Q8A67_020418 [Cirrhinus molitorella]|uniref:Uncharacterized protein n=1 Tax=Cirrhinus molitorella TaxID=172907 RepID=A0AA88TNN1_9TELE|nr:hypothetical protein Q8A67_020418 [Cirrhinus molitorella]